MPGASNQNLFDHENKQVIVRLNGFFGRSAIKNIVGRFGLTGLLLAIYEL